MAASGCFFHGDSFSLNAFSRTHIERGPYRAEILGDAHSRPARFHLIFVEQGSSEVVAWTQQSSFEQALYDAEAWLELHGGPALTH